jgi:hypothetical protein
LLAASMMHDPWNPSPDEIREWAYCPDAQDPCQDWDLAMLWSGHEKALLDCASDSACPNQNRMLSVLYFVVGDAVRSKFRSRARPIIEGFIDRGDQYPHPSIKLWQSRSRALLRDPSSFEFQAWCCGGLAKETGN